MNIETLIEKFGLATALVVILLGSLGWIAKLLWTYFTNKEKELQARLDEKDRMAHENQQKFIIAFNQISDNLITINENLKNISKIVELIRDKRIPKK